jgi:nicotinate-nucleotide adenylyltransferase
MLAGRTVVYGGSFNPPHMGHQMAILYLLEALGADRVWLLPAHVHAFGKALAPFEHRVAMARLLAAPFAERAEVSELEREVGSGRTYDVLVRAHRDHPDRRFALAVGADILKETRSWHRWSDIEAMVPVVVIGRGGHSPAGAGPLALPDVSSTLVRDRVARRESLEGLVPRAVADYIARQHLYEVRA